MTTTFSPDGSEVMSRDLETEVNEAQTPDDLLVHVYDLTKCEIWLKENGYKKVALQFPDELLCDASRIVCYLSSHSEAKIFVLGDTSYGSCCVDEVSAEHHEADALIHFGHSCLSPTRRLPVIYVFKKCLLDATACADNLAKAVHDLNKPTLLVYDLSYHHIAEDVTSNLKKYFTQLSIALPNTSQIGAEDSKNSVSMLGRTFALSSSNTSMESYTILYIGQEGQSLSNWMMNLNRCPFHIFNTQTDTVQSGPSMNRALMKRFYMIEKAKDAQIVGILVGTLGVADYLAIIDRLKALIKKAGKKSYTFVVGKLNVAKLANFMEVDVYVLVSCPENSLIDSSEFYRPVVTPYEMEVACNQAREWTGDYVTDYRQLLPGESMFVEVPDSMKLETDVSLVTGGVRHIGLDEEDQSHSEARQVVEAKPLTLSTVTTAGEKLSERSWQGLEQKLGETPVVKAVEGLKGIAMGYEEEPDTLPS